MELVSTWEAWTLHRKGRVRLSRDMDVWLARATRSTRIAPLTHEITLVAMQLPMDRDPADRFLAATAKVLDLTLVTADEKLLGLSGIRTLANR
jgi:PIN domain nuclease of toxin-antitoxin system